MIDDADLRHCSDLLQERDRAVWLATLLMPQPLRDATTILWAWHNELTAIARIVTEPMAGEVRLQWWAEIAAGNRSGDASGHPVARALLALVAAYDLPPQTLDAKVSAHVFDLYADPMGERDMFEGYAGETRSALYQLAWLCADPDKAVERATASGHAGVAQTVADVIGTMAGSFQRQRVYMPSDLLTATGFDAASFLAATPEARGPSVQAFAEYGLEHFEKARTAIGALERDGNGAHLAYLPMVASERILLEARKDPVGVQTDAPRASSMRTQWKLWRVARSGRF